MINNNNNHNNGITMSSSSSSSNGSSSSISSSFIYENTGTFCTMEDSTAFIFFKIQNEQTLWLTVCVNDVMHRHKSRNLAAECGDVQPQAPPTPFSQQHKYTTIIENIKKI